MPSVPADGRSQQWRTTKAHNDKRQLGLHWCWCKSQPLGSREKCFCDSDDFHGRGHWAQCPQLRQISDRDTISQQRPPEEWMCPSLFPIICLQCWKVQTNMYTPERLSSSCHRKWPSCVSFQLTPDSLPKGGNKTSWRSENIQNKPSLRSNGRSCYAHK